MALNKYSEALQDAYMIGDLDKIAELKALIDASVPKMEKISSVIPVSTMLSDEKSSARSMYDYMNKRYGEDWWENEIETIHKMIWVDFGVVLSDVNRDKLLGVRHICKSDAPFIDWYEFNQVALAVGGAIADFFYLKNPSVGMTINAVKTLRHIRDDSFNEEVIKYICINLINEGVYTPPPSIAWLIAEDMSKLTREWKTGNWKSVGEKFDSREVDESPEGVQARRLIVAEEAAKVYFS